MVGDGQKILNSDIQKNIIKIPKHLIKKIMCPTPTHKRM